MDLNLSYPKQYSLKLVVDDFQFWPCLCKVFKPKDELMGHWKFVPLWVETNGQSSVINFLIERFPTKNEWAHSIECLIRNTVTI